MADYKFKKGDRVRIVADPNLGMPRATPRTKHKEGDVVYVLEDNAYQPWIGSALKSKADFLTNEGEGYAGEKDLELIEPQYKKLTPKVGDKFRLVKTGWYEGCAVGDVLVVTGMRSGGYYKFDACPVNKDPNFVTTEYLEPLEEECSACEGSGECQHASHFTDCPTGCDCEDRVCQECYGEKPECSRPDFIIFDECEEPVAFDQYQSIKNIETYMKDWIAPEINKQTLKQKAMNFYRKAKMSKEEKTLFKAGYINDDGSPTTRGSEASEFVSFKANQVELVKMAEADIKEAEDAK